MVQVFLLKVSFSVLDPMASSTPEPVRTSGSPLGPLEVAATSIDHTPDSERIRRCLEQEVEDVAPADVQEGTKIQADACYTQLRDMCLCSFARIRWVIRLC